MSTMHNLFTGVVLAVVSLGIVGCGAGSADIPASVPHPRKMSDAPGKSLADVAQSKGMSMPTPPTGRGGQFNPTNP